VLFPVLTGNGPNEVWLLQSNKAAEHIQ